MARRFGPRPKDLSELRTQRITVWMTAAEMAALDSRRGSLSRSERLRLAEAGVKPMPLPPIVPAINRDVWSELAQGPMSNLHQLVKRINELERFTPGEGLRELSYQLSEVIDIAHGFRDGLLGAHSSGMRMVA
jgi:hypothetical protein